MAVVECSKVEFFFTWRLENYKMCPHKNGEYLTSPTFLVKDFYNTRWNLEIYFKGKDKDCHDHISLFLRREEKDEGPDVIEITHIKLSIPHVKFKTTNFNNTFKRGDQNGFRCFMAHDEMNEVDDYFFVVECLMRMPSFSNVCPKKILFSILPSLSICREVSSEIQKQLEQLLKRLGKYPNQCFVNSKLLVVSRIFTCPIQDFILPNSMEKQFAPKIKITESSCLLITLFTTSKRNIDYLEIELLLENKLKSNAFLSGDIHFLNSSRKVVKSAKFERLFQSENESETLLFEQFFKWSDLNRRESCSLLFELKFCDGHLFSEPEWAPYDGYSLNFQTETMPNNCFSREMFRLYKEKKFCDVTLHTLDRTFEVHKNVLCAMSPVFSAMFESDMKEKDTNTVHVKDLDSDTVSHMLDFMYTVTVDLVETESVAKLFAAGDKYQIHHLKDVCRNILKNVTSVENICVILELADLHQDEILRSYAVDFISIHKAAILVSPQWKDFGEKNAHLGFQVLQEVCVSQFKQ